ncbi:hypothetical protein A3K86_18360 [Photobacterium jeanii]|uniref:Uncharacterized protein n=1 Tax=Photobacterium jeanii TaxID=858640 RepID=A0A178K1G9_9GAMM|nr:hypothetical protein A3K86_18360 [Photobacterium jeanii]PST90463.1 hypothetical protein C9I91_07460 [Photobacterium jeanii]
MSFQFKCDQKSRYFGHQLKSVQFHYQIRLKLIKTPKINNTTLIMYPSHSVARYQKPDNEEGREDINAQEIELT